ncbi:competence protein ComGD [Enterococcus sp. DIV0788_1]
MLMKSNMLFMKKQKRNDVEGFTLIELLIVLIVVISFVLLPTLALKSWQEELEKRFFYYQFEKSVLHVQQMAITDHRGTQVDLYQDQQLIIFFTNDTKLAWRQLEVPESITLVSENSILFSAGKGNISTTQIGVGSIPRVIFTESNAQQRVIYQFQLGSGRFERK